MPENEIEAQLVAEAKAGGNYALSRLLQENYGQVYHFLCRLTLDSQAAADITQDCMERVIQKFSSYDPEKSAFATWMITVAKNLFIEECRRGGRRRKLAEKIAAHMAPGGGIENEAEKNDELSAALCALDAKQRVPILMKHAAGYSYEEIASSLNIPVGTVKSRISAGIKKIRKELSDNER